MKQFRTALQAIGWIFSEQLESTQEENEQFQIAQDDDRNQWVVIKTIKEESNE